MLKLLFLLITSPLWVPVVILGIGAAISFCILVAGSILFLATIILTA